MSTMEMLINEVEKVPDAMLEEVLDFVQFLKSKRFAPTVPSASYEEIEVIFDRSRTLTDLANEQSAFLASLSVPLIDVELPAEV